MDVISEKNCWRRRDEKGCYQIQKSSLFCLWCWHISYFSEQSRPVCCVSSALQLIRAGVELLPAWVWLSGPGLLFVFSFHFGLLELSLYRILAWLSFWHCALMFKFLFFFPAPALSHHTDQVLQLQRACCCATISRKCGRFWQETFHFVLRIS